MINPIRFTTQFSLLKPYMVVGCLILLFLLTTRTSSAQSCMPYPSPQARFGFNVAREAGRKIENYDVAPLKAHWYLDYTTQITPARPADMTYAQMIRPPAWQRATFTTTTEATLQNNPGALWIIGNEPDRDKQDGLTPADYAVFYHAVYTFLKTRDPSAHIAVAGVVQSTPLRRRYLDMVLTEYQTRYGAPMPIDVWTMHAFILPEDYIWGASIPPGLEAYVNEGMKYTILDHDKIEIFKNNIIDFRAWMANRGYRDTPLIVTEYGILLSVEHGFTYEKVRAFMLSSFDFFLTATNASTGYPADGNRLVQAWSWFSLNYPPYNEVTFPLGHNGNLMEPNTAALLPLGQDYANYVTALDTQAQIDLAFPTLQLTPSFVVLTPTVPTTPTTNSKLALELTPELTPNNRQTFTLTAMLANQGSVAACDLTVHLYYQDLQGKQTWLATRTINALDAAGTATDSQVLSFTWETEDLEVGLHKLILMAEADNANTGLPTSQMRQEYPFHVLAEAFSDFIYLPVASR